MRRAASRAGIVTPEASSPTSFRARSDRRIPQPGRLKVYKAGESFFEPPGSKHLISENASATEPARLLAVFIADDGVQLTTFDRRDRQCQVPERSDRPPVRHPAAERRAGRHRQVPQGAGARAVEGPTNARPASFSKCLHMSSRRLCSPSRTTRARTRRGDTPSDCLGRTLALRGTSQSSGPAVARRASCGVLAGAEHARGEWSR